MIPLWKRNTWMNLYIFINNEYTFNNYKAVPNMIHHLQNNDQQEESIKHITIQANVCLVGLHILHISHFYFIF